MWLYHHAVVYTYRIFQQQRDSGRLLTVSEKRGALAMPIFKFLRPEPRSINRFWVVGE